MEELIQKAQKGDRDAFVALLQEQELALYRAAKAVLQNEADVEDAVAETVCKAFDKLQTLRRPKYFKTWLTSILLHNCYDILRRRKGQVSSELIPEAGYEEERESALDVRESLAALGENDRLALTLFYLNDLSVREISKLLSISENAVKARLSHGRKKFRQVYEEREQETKEKGWVSL